MLQRIPPCITLHRNLVLRHSSTKRKHVYLTRKVRLMNTASSAPGGPARSRSNSQAATLQSSSAAFGLSKIPTTPFSSLGPALLQMMYSYHNRSLVPVYFARSGRLSKPRILAWQGDGTISRPSPTSFVCTRRNILASAQTWQSTHLQKYDRIMASSPGKRATHRTTNTLLNSAGAGVSIAVTLALIHI